MLGFEVSPIVQYVVAFAIIAILLALFAIVLKRIGGNRFAMSGGERGRGRQPRWGSSMSMISIVSASSCSCAGTMSSIS